MRGQLTEPILCCPLFWPEENFSIYYFFSYKSLKKKVGKWAEFGQRLTLVGAKGPKTAKKGRFSHRKLPENAHKFGHFLPTFDFRFGHLPTFLATKRSGSVRNAHKIFSKVGKVGKSGHGLLPKLDSEPVVFQRFTRFFPLLSK